MLPLYCISYSIIILYCILHIVVLPLYCILYIIIVLPLYCILYIIIVLPLYCISYSIITLYCILYIVVLPLYCILYIIIVLPLYCILYIIIVLPLYCMLYIFIVLLGHCVMKLLCHYVHFILKHRCLRFYHCRTTIVYRINQLVFGSCALLSVSVCPTILTMTCCLVRLAELVERECWLRFLLER